MSEWLSSHEHWVPWIRLLAIVSFVGSLALLPWVVVRIPVDYFARRRPPTTRFRRQHPVLRGTIWVLRNLVGAVLVAAGIAMLVLPGQGLLTIAIGLVTADFPGKRRLELWLVSRPGILKSLNWIRTRRGRDPLVAPDADEVPGAPDQPAPPTSPDT